MRIFSTILLATLLLSASNLNSEVDRATRCTTIEQEITLLKSDKKVLKSKAMDLKYESYKAMTTDWEKYSRLLKKIEHCQSMATRIDNRIQELNTEKTQLSKVSSPKP